jgi:hypothetical protein
VIFFWNDAKGLGVLREKRTSCRFKRAAEAT